MNNIEIDTAKLESEIKKIVKTKEFYSELLDKLKTDTDLLKDYWDTDVSASVFSSFEEFYKDYKNSISDIENDIAFLENVVSKSYELEDTSISKAVNENLL